MDEPLTRDPAAGFTLIELMIAVTVLALLTTTVSLSVNRPQRGTGTDWARFEAVHERLRQQSVLSREVLGLQITAEGYRPLRRAGGTWVVTGDLSEWRGSVVVLAPFDGQVPVRFTPAGRTSAVRLRFEDGAQVRVCESDGWSPVTCDAG